MKALLDTNILIEYLNGVEHASQEIALYKAPLISPITWMEVMSGVQPDEESRVRTFLAHFTQVPIDAKVAEITVSIRHERRIRLPDAIIWASAQAENALLVSRNTRDFPSHSPSVRVPYKI